MTQKQLIALGKALLALSFLFIFTGLYLDFEERGSFSDPINDTTLLADGDRVIISVVDDEDIVIDNPEKDDDSSSEDEDNSSDDKEEPPIEDKPEESVPEQPSSPAPIPPVSKPEPQVPTPKPEVTPPTPTPEPPKEEVPKEEDKKEEEKPPVVSLEETNQALRKSIEDTYGIQVRYGSETDGYSAGTMKVVSLSDQNSMKDALEKLNATLALYPKNFFKEFGDSKFKLKVYLIQRYQTANVTGVTELYGSTVTISISMDYPFEESFHHEAYHYIEHFIEKNGGEFSIWNTYNPSDFSYGGTANESLSFNRTWVPNVPFVNNYAQSDADEDRASTFEYMTANTKASCFNSIEYPIRKKATYMALMIDTYFDSVDPSVIEYWERFIN